MKVANIIEDGRIGGPQIRIVKVANALRTFCDYTVVIPKKENTKFVTLLNEKSVKFKEMPLHRLSKEPMNLALFVILFFYETILLARYFKKEKFDIVHVSGGSWQWKGVIAAKYAKCKIIWHLNDTQMDGFVLMVFRLLVTKVDGLAVAGEMVKKFYLDNLNIKFDGVVEVIHAPVDCEYYDPRLVRNNNNLMLDGAINVVTVASVSPVKGLERMIKAAHLVGKTQKKINWYVVGPTYPSQNSYRKMLDELIEKYELDNVYFVGSKSDVRAWLLKADIYLCTSIAEASPTSVWEAMAMEVPIISSEVGDVPKFIVSGCNGILVGEGEPINIADAVNKLANDIELREKLSQKSRKIIIDNMELSVVSELHKKIYKSV